MFAIHHPSRHALAWLLLWSIAWPALVLAANPPAQEPEWTPSPDGQWLHQRSTSLVWQRSSPTLQRFMGFASGHNAVHADSPAN